ncbi:MAG: chaperonin GroEL [Pseudomonadota bacterium]|jgi:chaperonin GroEL
MSSKDILFSDTAREKIMAGVDKLADAVCVTLGPKGRNVIIDKYYSGPYSTKDGVSVAKIITLADRSENVGAQFLKQVAMKTSENAGDGTTTATVLGRAMMREGMKALAAGVNPMDIKRGIDLAVEYVVFNLKQKSKMIETEEEIFHVSCISANSDRDIATIITKAFKEVGRDGFINIFESKQNKTTLEIVNGITIYNGYSEPNFCNTRSLTCEYDNPYIFLYENNIQNSGLFSDICKIPYDDNQTPLLFITNGVKDNALTSQMLNINKNSYHTCSVEAPSFHYQRKNLFDDMSIILGCELVKTSNGEIIAEHINKNIYGRAKKTIVSKNKTIIIDGKGDPELIQDRKKLLEEKLVELKASAVPNEEEINNIKERLSNFNGGAVIHVGGKTPVEMKERYDRYDDSLHATRAAIEEGVLPGGGIALFKSIDLLDDLLATNDDVNAGIKIVKKALAAPFIQISTNAGINGNDITLKNSDYNYGYDAQNDMFGDMFEMGIIDPTKVVRCALEDAASVAGSVLITAVLVTDLIDDNKNGNFVLPPF